MKCPVCKDTSLVMTERQAIEIDYCPDCRGVWLDRGELDKIIERTTQEKIPQPQGAADFSREPRRDEPRRDEPRRDEPRRDDYRRDERRDDDRRHYEQKPHKRKSLLGEIFDF